MAQDLKKQEAQELKKYSYDAGDAGAGAANETPEDWAMPFLQLVQANSPLVADSKAKAGQFYNTLTEQSIDAPLEFIPAASETVYVEWRTRAAGGGLVGRHDRDSDLVRRLRKQQGKFKTLVTDDNTELVETIYLYGICVNVQKMSPAVLPFWSTKLNAYKRWRGQMKEIRVPFASGTMEEPPFYACPLKVDVFADSNAKGKFYNIRLLPMKGDWYGNLIDTDDPRFQTGKALCKAFDTGQTSLEEDDKDEVV